MPGAYRAIYQAYQTGKYDQAIAVQRRANAVTSLLISMGFVGAFREVMAMLGFDCGCPRLPNLPLPEAQRAELHRCLAELDFAALAAL
jgi:dihydrodipicolinate synthase/N-acetylneuraminate lyase